jgi:DNA-nicking Smr family endonuclease
LASVGGLDGRAGASARHQIAATSGLLLTQPPGKTLCQTRPGGKLEAMKLKLDLHDIYNHGGEIDRALQAIIDEAVAKKAPLVEIIPGKGSGQLKKHVLRFLERKDIKALYHRIEKDKDNFGRVFVHFRWK